MNKLTPQTENPKLKQFLDELNKLTAKYQYTLIPTIKWTATGAMPELSVRDVPPPVEPEKIAKTKEIDKK